MMRLFLPLLLAGLAIGLFALYTNPTYQNIKALSIQNASFDDALTKAQDLRATRDSLLAKRDSFSPADIDKLQHILPDNVDNIRLIIDINNIAARHGLSLANVSVGTIGGKQAPDQGTAGTAAMNPTSPTGSVDVAFSVTTASYDQFLAFLQDIEHSLRILDVTQLGFSTASTGSGITYTLTVRTYWLHQDTTPTTSP